MSSLRKNRILVVEDNVMNKVLVKEILMMHGYDIIEAETGAEAIELVNRDRPDLVLMDINLPVMDGVTAAKLLKGHEFTKSVPIIALTASAMRGDDEKFLSEGFDGYVQKPIEIKNLMEKVRLCLGG